MRERGEGSSVLLITAGFGLWSLAFVLLYSFQAVGCRLGWQELEVMGDVTLQRVVLIGLFAGGIATHLLLWRKLRRLETMTARAEEGFEIGEHTSELQSRENLVCRLLLEKKKA